jgi:hypothetical protein
VAVFQRACHVKFPRASTTPIAPRRRKRDGGSAGRHRLAVEQDLQHIGWAVVITHCQWSHGVPIRALQLFQDQTDGVQIPCWQISLAYSQLTLRRATKPPTVSYHAYSFAIAGKRMCCIAHVNRVTGLVAHTRLVSFVVYEHVNA